MGVVAECGNGTKFYVLHTGGPNSHPRLHLYRHHLKHVHILVHIQNKMFFNDCIFYESSLAVCCCISWETIK